MVSWIILDIHPAGTADWYATGLMAQGNNPYQIRRSQGGSAIWDAVYTSNGSGFGSSMRALDVGGSGTNWVAVGDYGRIVRSSNGTTWTTYTGTNVDLKDVVFAAGNTCVAVGDGAILRSTDSGASWTVVHTGPEQFTAVHFPTALVGYAVTFDREVFTTTNGGLNWALLGAPVDAAHGFFSDVHFTSVTEGFVLTRDEILHTLDGGQHWEWFPCAQEMKKLHMRSAAIGWAVGEGGSVYRTGGGGSYRPMARFQAPTSNLCPDAPITFVNESAPGLSAEWFVNDVFVSDAEDLVYTFTPGGTLEQVTLVVSNGVWTDTLTRSVSIGPSLEIEMAPIILADTVCAGQSTQVQVPQSQQGTVFQLYRGTTAQGPQLPGNGNTLVFNTGVITTPTEFRMVASRVSSGCGSSTDTVAFTVQVGTPRADLLVGPGPSTVCRGDLLEVTVANSEPLVNYQLRRNNISIGAPQTGTGGVLAFPLGPQQQSATYSILATHVNGCSAVLLQTVPIVVLDVAVHWGTTMWNPPVGTPFDLLNGSGLQGATYQWTFDAGTNMATSTSAEPTDVVYSTAGPHTVQLIGIDQYGCRDTLVQTIHAVLPGQSAECAATQVAKPFDGGSSSLTYDGEGDLFSFHMLGYESIVALFSGDGDELYRDLPEEDDNDRHAVLVKHDAAGRPQWYAALRTTAIFQFVSDVVTDAQGNVYVSYFHNGDRDSVNVIDASGAQYAMLPAIDGAQHETVVVLSFTPQGRLRWMNSFLDYYLLDQLHVHHHGANALYVQGIAHLVKFNATTGAIIWTEYEFAYHRSFAVDPNGIWVGRGSADMVMKRVLHDGTVAFTTPPITATPAGPGWPGVISLLAMVGDGLGSVYRLDVIYGTAEIAGVTVIGDDSPSDGHFALTKFNSAGVPVWCVPFDMDGNAVQHGMALANGRVLVYMRSSDEDTLQMEGVPNHLLEGSDVWIISVDVNGNAPQADLIYRSQGELVVHFTDPTVNTLVANNAGDRIAMWVPFATAFVLNGDTVQSISGFFPNEAPLGNSQTALLHGEAACILQGTADATVLPTALFNAEQEICAGNATLFTDVSTGAPTSRSWSFQGGIPSTSTAAMQNVYYGAPGDFTFSLTVSNQAGSTTTIGSIHVDICAGISVNEASTLSLAPNPASDVVRIASSIEGPQQLRCFDTHGRMVWSGTLPQAGTLDVSAFPSGLYHLIVQHATGETHLRLVVAH